MPPYAPSQLAPLGQPAAAFADQAASQGLPGGRREHLALYARLFRNGDTSQPGLHVTLPTVGRVQASDSPEGTVLKFTHILEKAAPDRPPYETESVLIPMVGRNREKGRTYTLCVSSQVGCAMGCTFCQTAQMGLVRSLTAGEIVAQWFTARHTLEAQRSPGELANIVFMGMGEPMDNLDAVIGAVEVLTDRYGPAVAMSKITISTVGRVDGIRRLAARVREPGWHRLGLAVSLNAPNDEVRSAIMPINRSTPLGALREALLEWPLYTGKHFCLEYVLIPGVNDEERHAGELADYVNGKGAFAGVAGGEGKPLRGMVNVIPYNPRDNSPWPAPSEEAVEAFMGWLAAAGVYVKRRRTKGRDAMAACGQLGNPEMRRRGVPVKITRSEVGA